MTEIPYGYCHCGCGQLAPIAKMTAKISGHIKGQPMRFIYGHYSKTAPSGCKSANWRGGTRKHNDKISIYMPGHHREDDKHYVLEHIIIAENVLGKPILKCTPIHHIDRTPANNKNNNLVICENKAYHGLLHQRQRAYDACGNPHWRKCCICKKYDDPANLYFNPNPNAGAPRHRLCRKLKDRSKL